MIYVDVTYYKEKYLGTLIPPDALDKALKDASQQVDALTYNRINQFGFEALSDFRKEVIQETVCKLADFNIQNEDILNMILGSYSINGVSMDFSESLKVGVINGVPIKLSIYSYLEQSGLCCASLGRL